MLQIDCDLAEEWFLKLWEAAPTPADALRLRASQVEKLDVSAWPRLSAF
jgi:hypothetical protein